MALDLSHGVQTGRARTEYQETLEQLRTSQERFSRIFEITPNGIVLSDLETGAFVEVNEGFCQIVGYSREEMIGKTADELGIWVDKSDRNRFNYEVTHHKQLTDYEMEFRKKDRSLGFGVLKARSLHMDHREMVISVITDLTGQHKLVETQMEVDERYQLMTENMSEVIWLIDSNFLITYVSGGVQAMLGFDPSDLVGIEWKSVFTEPSYQSLVDFVGTLENSKQKAAIPFLVNFIAEDHSKKSAEINISRMVDSSNGLVSWLCVARDITDRLAIEEALHESEIRWQYALEGSGDGVWDWNLIDNSVYYSPRLYVIAGYPETEHWTTVEDWSSRVHPDDFQPAWNAINDYINGTTTVYQIEFRIRCADGSYKWIMDRGKIIARDALGTPIRLVGVHTDISESKQMVQALQESESQFRLLAERSSDIISRNSPTGKILYISPACEYVLGFTEEELKVKNLIELVHPEDRALVKFVVEHLNEYQEIQPLQFRLINKTGNYIWAESTAKMIRNTLTGEFEEVQLTTRDVSSRVAAETALRESEEKLRALISQSVDGIVLISEEGKIIEWSKGQERLTGIPSSRAIDQFLWKIQYDTVPDEEKTEERKTQIMQQTSEFFNGSSYTISKPSSSEWEIQRMDGSKLFIQSTVFPIHTAHGYMGGAISRDITDIKIAELERKKSEERLRFITDNMIDVVSFVDENMVIQYVSPSVYGSLGYNPEDMQQKQLADFIHPNDFKVLQSNIEERKIQGLFTFQVEYRIRDIGQTYVWQELLVNLVFNPQGKYTGAILGSRDITIRKQFDDALRASENRYRTLATNFPNGIVMLFDLELRFQHRGWCWIGFIRDQTRSK